VDLSSAKMHTSICTKFARNCYLTCESVSNYLKEIQATEVSIGVLEKLRLVDGNGLLSFSALCHRWPYQCLLDKYVGQSKPEQQLSSANMSKPHILECIVISISIRLNSNQFSDWTLPNTDGCPVHLWSFTKLNIDNWLVKMFWLKKYILPFHSSPFYPFHSSPHSNKLYVNLIGYYTHVL